MTNLNPKLKKIIRFFLTRLPFVLLLSLLIMAGSLKLVEKYPVPIKEGFEKVLNERTGTYTTIGTIDKISFIPDFRIIMNSLTMHNRDNAAIVELEIGKFEMRAPFWVVFLNGNKINHLYAADIKANKGVLSPYDLEIKSIEIVDRQGPEQYGSFLVAEGKYAGHKMIFESSVEKVSNGYKIKDKIPFSLQLDNYNVTGNYTKKISGAWIKDIVFSKQNKRSESQDYILVKSGEYNKDNPLACMIINKDLNLCDEYLEKKEN